MHKRRKWMKLRLSKVFWLLTALVVIVIGMFIVFKKDRIGPSSPTDLRATKTNVDDTKKYPVFKNKNSREIKSH